MKRPACLLVDNQIVLVRVSNLLILLVLMSVGVCRPAHSQSHYPFSYNCGGSFVQNEPDSGGYTTSFLAYVVATVNTTCIVHNDNLIQSSTGNFTTVAQVVVKVAGGNDEYINQIHTTARGQHTLGPNANLDIGNDSASGGNDFPVGTYQAQCWSGVDESSAQPNYGWLKYVTDVGFDVNSP